jgi:hypothetical protein
MPPPKPEKKKSDRFVVKGVVRVQGSGKPLHGIVVRAYDKDRRTDDYLGRDTTDADGRYEIGFPAAAFRQLFERRPDLYVQVYNDNGQQLATTKDSVRWNAGKVEEIDIEVPEDRLG